jgi:DNA-binding MarR family transcriptional regulator
VTAATEPAVTDAERELGTELDLALGRLYRWHRRSSPTPFAPGALSALGTVVDAGRLRLGDLASREGIAPASLTRTVAFLEGKGLLVRSVDPLDRRSVFVEATPAGGKLVRDRRRERGEGLAARLSPLTESQLQAMRDIVRAINDLAGCH